MAVTISVSSLQSWSFETLKARDLDGSPIYWVEAVWPNGGHAKFLSPPVVVLPENEADFLDMQFELVGSEATGSPAEFVIEATWPNGEAAGFIPLSPDMEIRP